MGGLGYTICNSSSVALDYSGNIYTTGWFLGTIDFDPGLGVNNLTDAGGYNPFIQKLDSTGNFIWTKSIGGG